MLLAEFVKIVVPFACLAERCVYCETKGNRIVHPPKHGRTDFELYTEEEDIYNNDSMAEEIVDCVELVEDGEIYSSYTMS